MFSKKKEVEQELAIQKAEELSAEMLLERQDYTNEPVKREK